jgi:hypothetical protein
MCKTLSMIWTERNGNNGIVTRKQATQPQLHLSCFFMPNEMGRQDRTIMFKSISDWLFKRALRISHASTVKLAKMTGQSVQTLEHLNDAGAGIIAQQAVDAISQATAGK